MRKFLLAAVAVALACVAGATVDAVRAESVQFNFSSEPLAEPRRYDTNRDNNRNSNRYSRSYSNYGGKQVVEYSGQYAPGTIVINTGERRLYLVLEGGRAIRYGVGVGRAGFSWSGTARVGRKAVWPTWTPPAEMRAREPHLPVSMPGGPENPLGARALYLYQNGRDTLYRIHGTFERHTIGLAVSSGCIRMLNEEVIDLYQRVPIGARVVVL